MKQFHIISTGVSVLRNAMENGVIEKMTFSDENYWGNLLSNSKIIKELLDFLKRDPKQYSAELKSFLNMTKDVDKKNVEVYLFGTQTNSNELSKNVISRYLTDSGYSVSNSFEVDGYFRNKDYSYVKDVFKKGMVELLDRLLYISDKKQKEGYKVYFNATAGFKAHVIVVALAGFLTDCEVYYMNEEFNEVITIPAFLYIPDSGELDILNEIIENGGEITGENEVREFSNNREDEILRLKLYYLIDETDNRIRLLPRARKIIEKFRKY